MLKKNSTEGGVFVVMMPVERWTGNKMGWQNVARRRSVCCVCEGKVGS